MLLVSLAVPAQTPQIDTPLTVETKKDKRTDGENVLWRSDLKACAWTKNERFYSYSSVSIFVEGEMRSVSFPTYEQMTGFPEPDPEKLHPRGRDHVIGWDKDGRLIYSIFRSPLHTFAGKDPLCHLIYLEVLPDRMKVLKIEHEMGEWRNGDWIREKEAQQERSGRL